MLKYWISYSFFNLNLIFLNFYCSIIISSTPVGRYSYPFIIKKIFISSYLLYIFLFKYEINNYYRIRRCLVPLCKFDKILVVVNLIEQNFILKILVLEIISRKIFSIFIFIRYDTTIIQLLFWRILLICFAFSSSQWS